MVSYGRYWMVSAVAASVVLYHAFATRQYFYPTALYLSTSKLAVAVVGNLAFATALLLHKALIKIFLGSLRDIEQELIRERLSSAIMESLLALTIFREEFSGFFVAMFAGLVFVKVMHWLVQDRVDYIEATPNVSRLQHLRIVAFMLVLLVVDAVYLQYTVSATIASGGQSVMLLFAFEYVIQASDAIRYFVKYSMSMLDLWLEGRWESKGTCVFYLELITDLLHLFVYVVFFVIVFTNYGLPLHLVRDLYSTFRNFRNRILDFLRFRQVSARLDRLPDASAEDLVRCDGVCIICREEMSNAGSNKKLGCGHLFHTHCLRSWMARQQNCPTCRAPVFGRRQEAAAAQRAGAAAANPAAAGAGAAGGAEPAAAAGGRGGAAEAPEAAGGVAGAGGLPAALNGLHQHHHHHHHAQPRHGIPVPQQRLRFVAHRHGGHRDRGAAAGAAPGGREGAAAGAQAGSGDAAADAQVQVPFNLHLPAGLPLGPGLTLGLGNPFPTMVPLFPTLLPALSPTPSPNSVLEQQAAAAAAAAALAAAAAVGAYNPAAGFMWAPQLGVPGFPPQGGNPLGMPGLAPSGGGLPGGATAPQQAAAAAAACMAAASAVEHSKPTATAVAAAAKVIRSAAACQLQASTPAPSDDSQPSSSHAAGVGAAAGGSQDAGPSSSRPGAQGAASTEGRMTKADLTAELKALLQALESSSQQARAAGTSGAPAATSSTALSEAETLSQLDALLGLVQRLALQPQAGGSQQATTSQLAQQGPPVPASVPMVAPALVPLASAQRPGEVAGVTQQQQQQQPQPSASSTSTAAAGGMASISSQPSNSQSTSSAGHVPVCTPQSTAGAGSSSAGTSNTADAGASASPASTAAQPSLGAAPGGPRVGSSSAAATTSSAASPAAAAADGGESKVDSAAEEIRRKRLERFQQS